ncbi:unnamed protein product [Bursaphelenchus xylophilus]|uniref:(pine wood nematode) hypothetical protein n=1 Tax=Bursaphelenchus xylophilus TaxID=6326 RepID=A0A1I7RJW5_BURXY|nr:unnamed protein product [Bursaphelenchus xylophilus]CAG9129115.1 unnamed protein product [Bursaphelenchus xylophilus]
MSLTIRPAPCEENPYAWDISSDNATVFVEPYDELGNLSKILLLNYTVTSLGGGILSFLMLYLVLFKTSGALKNYQNMLLICCSTDLIYWAVDNFMWMKFKETDGVFMIKMEGLAGHLGRPYRVFTMAFYVWIISFLNIMLPVQFYYRYHSLTRNGFLSASQTLALSFFSLILTLPNFFLSYASYNSSPEERPGFNYGTLWYQEYPMPNILFGDVRSVYQKAYFFYGGAIISVSFIIALVIGYRTLQRIKQMRDSYSDKTKRLQKQLSDFMIVQAMIPVCVCVIPVMSFVIPAFFYLDTGMMCVYSAIAVSWIPVLNPIITIMVIIPFRRIVCGVFHKRVVVNTSYNRSTTDQVIP